MEEKIIVIDTNIFVNPDSFKVWGKNPYQALENFLQQVSSKSGIKIYCPPSVYEELANFVDLSKISGNGLSLINRKPPKKYEIFVPAMFFYEFIEEIRHRTNKGLRIVEKYIKKSKSGIPEPELIKAARQEYRVAIREGVVDSKEDIDLLVLSRQMEALLATTDKGLVKWADKLGIETINSSALLNIINCCPLRKNQ